MLLLYRRFFVVLAGLWAWTSLSAALTALRGASHIYSVLRLGE